MSETDLKAQIKALLADKLSISAEEIKDDTLLFDELGLDSFDTIELVFELEEKTGIEIPDSDLKELKSVKDIAEYIKTRNTA